MISLFEHVNIASCLSIRKGTASKAIGFTLVETVMAIGIVVFAMLPIMGLVPVGLGNLREAISSTVESQILQTMSNEILLTKYDTVVQKYQAGVTSTYDEEGTLLSSIAGVSAPTASPASQTLYTVTVTLKDVSPLASAAVSTASKCALIEIRRANSLTKVSQYTLLIPKA